MTTALGTREAPAARTPSTSTPTAVRTDDRLDATAPAGVGLLAARLFGFLVVIGALAAAMGGWLLVLM